MENKNKAYAVVTILLVGLGATVEYFFLPEIEKKTYDVAAATWFVAVPLYLFVKRRWTINQLTPKLNAVVDNVACAVCNGCLAYTALLVDGFGEMFMRVLFVWLACAVMWILVFRTKVDLA